jgi:hypothetical protein
MLWVLADLVDPVDLSLNISSDLLEGLTTPLVRSKYQHLHMSLAAA